MTFDAFLETFRDGGYAAFITFAISAIGAVLSLLILQHSRRTSERLIKIELGRDRQTDKEAKTASLRAYMLDERSPDRLHRDRTLVVENSGKGTARDVEIFLDHKPAGEHPAFSDDGKISVLGPESRKTFKLFPDRENPIPELIRIVWSEDTGTMGDDESTL